MAGTCWEYIVPFQPNIQQALDELRTDEFVAGNYYLEEHSAGMRLRMMLRRRGLPWRTRWTGHPLTIEELIDFNAESGTHSILDVTTIAPIYEFGTVVVLSEADVCAWVGTARPTRADMDEPWMESLERWRGVCVVLYKDDQPHELLFTGCSGD